MTGKSQALVIKLKLCRKYEYIAVFLCSNYVLIGMDIIYQCSIKKCSYFCSVFKMTYFKQMTGKKKIKFPMKRKKVEPVGADADCQKSRLPPLPGK